ncbi:MAG: NAD-dependent epimerase/dehydratase family protein [Acidimicrobiia bacterium]
MRALVTGGAGFIGSNLVDALIAGGAETRVLDNLSTGFIDNVHPAAELIEGDVADEDVVRKAVDGVDVVYHQAALRAVLRSVEDPLATDRVNSHGTLTVLTAARDAGVRRVVYASSSSVYGGAEQLPTSESAPTIPRSPYAVTKLTGEMYCRVFSELFGLETVSLRYFNVFGPRQRPDSAYAAVIPLFIRAIRDGVPPVVHGDGRQSRSFAYISDVVEANLAAAGAPPESAQGAAYNIAGAERKSLLDLLAVLGDVVGPVQPPVHTDPRPGDVRHTHADLAAAARALGFRPRISFEEGLRRTAAAFGA